MEQINKKALVKDFILKDEERFLLASDIFDAFPSIKDDMLKMITNKVVDRVNEKNNLKLELSDFGTKAGYYCYRFAISPEYNLYFSTYYYFKTCEIALCSTEEGFDKNNGTHRKLRDRLKSEFPDAVENNWTIILIKNTKYEMNNGSDYKDLFSVYSNKENLIESVCENFNSIFGAKIVRIINAINGQMG